MNLARWLHGTQIASRPGRTNMPDQKLAAMVDQPLPDLTLVDADGQPFALRKFVGKPLTLFFFTHLRSPG